MKIIPEVFLKQVESSHMVNAMKVHIKWRVVVGAVTTLVVLLVTYRVLFHAETCVEDYRQSDAATVLDEYCNPPSSPASGQEGDVPVAPDDAGGYTLVSLHIVIRHGDRTAIHSLPNTAKQTFDCRIQSDITESVPGMESFREKVTNLNMQLQLKQHPYENYTTFPDSSVCAHAALTPLGVAQHVRNGAFLRGKYSRHRLLGSNGVTDQVLVRGTRYMRTFHSAVAFLYGFLPTLDVNMLRFEMADNNTMCTEETRYQCWCPAVAKYLNVFSCTFHQELLNNLRDSDDKELYGHVRSLYRKLSEKLGVPAKDLPKLSHIFDVGATHFCHNKHLLLSEGGCVESQIIREMYDAVNMVGRKAHDNEDYIRIAKLKMQPLMYEIAHRMQHQIMDVASSKVVLYSGHDSTVEPLSCALGISSGVWPKYASRLVFELYAQHGERFLRVLLDGTQVTSELRFCKDRMSNTQLGLCKLQYFLDFVNTGSLTSINESDYMLACQKLMTT